MTRLFAAAVALVLCLLAPGLFLTPEAAAQTSGEETAGRPGDQARSAQRRRPRRRRPRRTRRRPTMASETAPAPAAEETAPADEESEDGEAPTDAEDSDASVRGRVEGGSAVAAAASGAAGEEEEEGASPSGSSLRRSNRMEFDPRLIRGESAGSGAVILFDRGRRALPPLAQRRRRFLRPTIEQAVGRERAARDASSDP